MFNYYKLDVIPIILNRFKVNNIILTGSLNEETMNQILKYCDDTTCSYDNILGHDSKILDTISDLINYDAIFLNDDSNWYTIFNELRIIKNCNDEFPLVFICNNIFPNKRRDSYINPHIIPKEFRQDYSKNLDYEGIVIQDNYYHAINENTPKNGVLTAIEDFLKENSSIGIMNIKLLNGITILYPKNSVSYIRVNKIIEEVECYGVYNDDMPDNIMERELLLNQLSQYNLSGSNIDVVDNIKKELNQKEKSLAEYKNKIKLHDDELKYKDSQVNNVNSKLSLQNAKIKNFESKLVNKDDEISNLNFKLQNANDEINSLKTNISKNKQLESKLNNEIKNNIALLNNKDDSLHQKDNQIRIKEIELNEMENQLNLIKRQYAHQLSKLDTKEYCINCYKEEISNNRQEIDYLKKYYLTRKLFTPLAYVYLIFKSNSKELSLNLKLYNALKNSKCFDVGHYLNSNKDLKNSKWCKYFSLELHYVCNGFNEKRKFNKKYYNGNSKKELLDYIIKCS